tara:strand:+ start:234 stop:464 length:231 start_codon:yes stop_codon:yes gene_type:complete
MFKKLNFRKEFLIFLKDSNVLKNFLNLVTYIFFGLTILGSNKTPNTKRDNGAIITKSDSIVIKFKIIFITLEKNKS